MKDDEQRAFEEKLRNGLMMRLMAARMPTQSQFAMLRSAIAKAKNIAEMIELETEWRKEARTIPGNVFDFTDEE